jgi:TPR repeat protein
MKKRLLAFIGCSLLCLGLRAQAADAASSAAAPSELMLREQKHFVECLASIYSPEWWFSYNGSLYFRARSEAQAQQLEAMKTARSKYVALTNREARYDLAARLIAGSGIGEAWQKKLLLPFSPTNQNLTPTLERQVHVVPSYKVLQSFPNGDALIQDDRSTMFVMNFGPARTNTAGTGALLIREGVKAYSSGGAFETVSAFENVALSPEETAVLIRVVAACREHVASLDQPPPSAAAKEEFEALQARATDSNPYMEYLLAKAYLEGKGTEKDEKLGMEWMRRAAKSGSGDALSYLQTSGRKAR